MCKRAINENADGDDIIIDVKRHTNLEDYIFLPNGWNDGLSPKVCTCICCECISVRGDRGKNETERFEAQGARGQT